MAIRLEKAWRALEREEVAKLPGQMGVYQVADAGGRVLRIGYAGGRSRFGLRGELAAELERRGGGVARFRYEVNMQYWSRFRELLMVHRADTGGLPPDNASEPPVRLGTLRPR